MALSGVIIPERSIRFGDCQLNASSFELRRGKRTVKLERIPLQVLLMLIDQHGRVVTREAIADQIWGKGVFVDVDNGINTAIRKIRHVLNDDPEKPRFVETITGVGYRFIAPLNEIDDATASKHRAAEAAHEVALPGNAASPATQTSEVAPTRRVWTRSAGILLAVLLIAAIGGWLAWRHFNTQRHVIRSIAVLPLLNLSGDPSQEYFSEGITDQLITDLARVGSLRVVSHTSVMQYKGTKKDLPEIGRELHVDAIVEGSVIRSGQRVRVTAQLVQAHNEQHLWADTYDRDRGDILTLQGEVANAITQEVRSQLTATQQTRPRSARAVNPAAYDDYLRGRFYIDNGFYKPDSLKKAQQYFEESIRTDPNFAPAYAGLASAYANSGLVGVLPRDRAYQSAREASARALQLDDSIGEAYNTLGQLSSQFDWDWEAADRAYNRAITLAPSYSGAHEDRAGFLALLGRRDEALAELAKIDQLDFSFAAALTETGVYGVLRDYPSLIDASKRGLLLAPNEAYLHFALGTGYEGTGKLQEAISEYRKGYELSGDSYADDIVSLAYAYSAVGKKAEAEKILRDLERKFQGTPDSSFTMARIYASLGDKDKAFEFLEKAYSEKSFQLPVALKADLVLDGLHSDPRFQSLLRRIGLNN